MVLLRNSLQSAIDISGYRAELEKNKTALETIIPHANEYYTGRIYQLLNQHNQFLSLIEKDIALQKEIVDELNNEIFNVTRKFFQENYQTELIFNEVSAIRTIKNMVMSEGSDDILRSRIHFYSKWEYPGMEIGCRDGEWTKYLVGSDPLYIIDRQQEFLDSTASQFTPEYQARLRKYLMKDFHVHGLPENQFGFIFSYNFFNYLSLDTIKQLLLQVHSWLRPGGVILFTYNNADLSASAGLAESYFMTYVPKSMLIPMVESIGFEIVDAPDYVPSTSWIELKKPGTISTIKAHQALGEIKYY